jgi:hypothetical protein
MADRFILAVGNCLFALLLASIPCSAVIVDRIAVVVDDRVVKDSDITRDIRITDFLNGDPLDFSEPARKKSAQRLIDQQLIRREVTVGGYTKATPEEADNFLDSIIKQRFQGNHSEYEAALQKYGITGEQLHAQLVWQITVLHFIEQRFRPAVMDSGPGVEKRVNELFEEWLDGAHQRAQIEYHETGLQ